MKNKLKVIFMALALVYILCMPEQKVFAADISSVNATGNSTSATISGTADNGVTAVVIMVYDSTGTNLVTMESVSVSASHTFTDTINLNVGSYLIKVADYEGGAFSETTVKVESSNTTENDNTSNGNGSDTNSPSNSSGNTTENDNTSNDNGSGQSVQPPKTGDTFSYEVYVMLLFAGISLMVWAMCNKNKKLKCD